MSKKRKIHSRSYLMETYGERNLELVKGRGVYVYTKENKKYLDFGSGIAVNSLGHCHPKLVKSITNQSKKIWHTSNLYFNEKQEKYAKKICTKTFADKVFFTNSGAEAIECGIKIIRKYFFSKGLRKKNKIITFNGAFHGRTITAISAQKNLKYSNGFGPLLKGFEQVLFNDIKSLKRKIKKDTAAILIETIQGEGGIRPVELKYLKELRKICNENNILLFIDEIQCGFGRSGKLFAYEWAKIKPDLVAVAKGIGSGFPMGACLATEKVAQYMTLGTHGSTFGGNPLAIAVGETVIDIISKKKFLINVDKTSRYLWKELNKLKNDFKEILEIRGAGLLLGIKFTIPNNQINKIFENNKLLTICASDNIVRLAPPLIIKIKHVDEAVRKIRRSLINYNN